MTKLKTAEDFPFIKRLEKSKTESQRNKVLEDYKDYLVEKVEVAGINLRNPTIKTNSDIRANSDLSEKSRTLPF